MSENEGFTCHKFTPESDDGLRDYGEAVYWIAQAFAWYDEQGMLDNKDGDLNSADLMDLAVEGAADFCRQYPPDYEWDGEFRQLIDEFAHKLLEEAGILNDKEDEGDDEDEDEDE